MGATVFSFLAFLVAVTTVSSLKNEMRLPTKAQSLHEHCAAKSGFVGECWNLNRVRNKPHCGPVACAGDTVHGANNRAHFFENAPDGLKCGRRSVCYQGFCRKLGTGASMPEQTTVNVDNLYDCFVVGGASTRRTI